MSETMTPAQERMAKARAARSKFNGADPAKFDHDGDGDAGGSLSAEVIARAQAQRETAEAAQRAEAQRQAKSAASSPTADAGPTSVQRGAAKAGEEEAERIRLARELARGGPVVDTVRVRVTKQGDGRVSTGQHVPSVGEVHYAWKEEFDIARPIAQALEDRYLVEIL